MKNIITKATLGKTNRMPVNLRRCFHDSRSINCIDVTVLNPLNRVITGWVLVKQNARTSTYKVRAFALKMFSQRP